MFLKVKKISAHTDLELIQKYKDTSDSSLAGELFSRYSHLVFGLCMKYLKDEEESRDAVMVIFEKLIEDLKKHDISNFKSWLYSVARNHCLMFLRKNSPTEKKSDSFMESGFVLHLHGEDETELNLQKLEDCIQKLLEAQRTCINLFFLDEKCYKEIEQQTGYTANEVKSYIQNGKRNLKNCMGRRNDE